jgi:oxaloacetate decarboxylase gamma subunit
MNPMFAEGLNLMLVGMGVVFAFLVLLVWIIGLMSRVVARLAPEPVASAPAAPLARAAQPAPARLDPNTLAVLREAVRKHRDAAR